MVICKKIKCVGNSNVSQKICLEIGMDYAKSLKFNIIIINPKPRKDVKCKYSYLPKTWIRQDTLPTPAFCVRNKSNKPELFSK